MPAIRLVQTNDDVLVTPLVVVVLPALDCLGDDVPGSLNSESRVKRR